MTFSDIKITSNCPSSLIAIINLKEIDFEIEEKATLAYGAVTMGRIVIF